MDRQLTPHFSLREMTRSDTAIRLGIDNTPNEVYLANLILICEHILEPVREVYGPVRVNSGYRSLALNMSINPMTSTATKLSQHCTGEAADFEVNGISNVDLANWCVANLPDFDQIILEFYTPGDPNSGWVHASFSKTHSRKEVWTAIRVGHIDEAKKTKYLPGIVA